MTNKIKLYTMLKVSGADTALEVFLMSLSFEETVLLSNHVYLTQSKSDNV